jgi:hypothetical protein
MTALTSSTRRRLKKLRQVPTVWEGDRRLLEAPGSSDLSGDTEPSGDCILWVDGMDESVRAMDVVPVGLGQEATVRTLLRAMETPTGPHAQPARPQRIVVRDREMQFFLRGVLQDLDITVDYTAELPLIDEIFQSLQAFTGKSVPQLPEAQADALLQLSDEIWADAPWESLDEEKIFAVKLDYGEIDTLYVSILGLLGMEYGLLMYRSLESLKRFRMEVMSGGDSQEHLEQVFLQQDCFFVTYDQSPGQSNGRSSSGASPVQPTFGSLHPLEGMQPILHEEEAAILLVALEALHRFFQKNLPKLDLNSFPAITGRYRIPDPRDAAKKVAVAVSTLPDVAQELMQMSEELGFGDDADSDEDDDKPVLRDDLIPNNSFYSVGVIPFELLESLRKTAKVYQPGGDCFPKKLDMVPVILIQTTRPKALTLLEAIQSAGGVLGIGFNPGEDSIAGYRYDLGILKTQDETLHLFGEFGAEDPIHLEARRKWDERSAKAKGQCGLIIAKGLSGASRGNPSLKDMLGFFEVRSLSLKDFDLGVLELVRQYNDL